MVYFRIGNVFASGTCVSRGVGRVKIVKRGESNIGLKLLDREGFWDDKCIKVDNVFRIPPSVMFKFSSLFHMWRIGHSEVRELQGWEVKRR